MDCFNNMVCSISDYTFIIALCYLYAILFFRKIAAIHLQNCCGLTVAFFILFNKK